MVSCKYLQQLTADTLDLHGIAWQACTKLRLKLADFGLACSFTPGEVLSSKVGTVLYCSPQAAQTAQTVGHCGSLWVTVATTKAGFALAASICFNSIYVLYQLPSETWPNTFLKEFFLPLLQSRLQGSQWCL